MDDSGIDLTSNKMTEEQKKTYDDFIDYLVILYQKYGCLSSERGGGTASESVEWLSFFFFDFMDKQLGYMYEKALIYVCLHDMIGVWGERLKW